MQLTNILKKNVEKLQPARKVDADILGPRLIFIICVLALVLFGLVMIFSASNVEALNHGELPFSYLFKQVLFCIVGILAAIAVWRWIPFAFWRSKWIWILYAGLFGVMLITLISGPDILGARRWIYIGPVSFQPSEFAKIILVLIISKYYAEYRIGHVRFRDFALLGGGLSLLMLAFILIGQSDLGTTVICVVGILAVLWIAGIPKWLFGTLVCVFFLAGVGAIILSGWRSGRFTFLDPWNDGQGGYGTGYQLIRSIYAFSEGGIFGVGLGNSYEKYQYLPEAETDFIYSIVGEELGFLGCLLVLAIFVVFLISGMMIVHKSSSRFAASISGAFIVMIVFQALLNICCTIGLAPTTGKPLPFISSGGSSLIATLVMVGFVLASSEYEAMPDEYERRRREFRASGNAEKETQYQYADERIDAEIQKTFNKVRNRAKQGVKPIPNTRLTKAEVSKIQQPKFIEDNKQRKNSSKRRASASSSIRTSQRRPTVKNNTASNKSYVYRRTKDEPSFKARQPKIKTESSRISSQKNKTRKRRGAK